MIKILGLKNKKNGDSLLVSLSKKKGVSPVIATVLLIVIVVVIGLIIFLWFRSLTQEAITKFEGTNIELVCNDVDFLVSYNLNTGVFSASNTGNVPIYDIHLRVTEGRSHKTVSMIDESDDWPLLSLRQGDSFRSENLKGVIEGSGEVDDLLAIPVLRGTANGEERSHICDDRHGQEIVV